MINVYCIVVTFNGAEWIDKCLSSLEKSIINIRTIVVDNQSTDKTCQIIFDVYPKVELIKLEKNLGFGAANNIGIKKAVQQGADYIFLLNQDAWIEPDSIEKLVNIHQQNADFGILSPMHLNAEYTALDYNFSLYISPNFCPNLYSDLFFNKVRDVYEVKFINAAAWLISRACINDVGLFNQFFYHYGEDVNYCQRVLYHNYKIGVCLSSKIVHNRELRKGVPSTFKGHKGYTRSRLISLLDVHNDFYKNFNEIIIRIIVQIIKNIVLFRFNSLRVVLQDLYFFLKEKRKIYNCLQNDKQKYRSPINISINL